MKNRGHPLLTGEQPNPDRMTKTAVKQRRDHALTDLVTKLLSAIGESLGTLVNRNLQLSPGCEMQLAPAHVWSSSQETSMTAIRAALEGGPEDGHCILALETRDAITLAGCLMMTPEEVIKEQRIGGVLDKDQSEAINEVGNVVFSGTGPVLREVLGPEHGLQVKDHAAMPPREDPQGILGAGDIVVYDFAIKIGDYPEAKAFLIFDAECASHLNGGQGVAVAEIDATEEDEADIPQAPVRGKLATFITSPEAAEVVRRCGRRVGLEIEHHANTDIPNPAAHRDGIVLIEIPIGEDRRFVWANRLKTQTDSATVVLLVHEPSRSRVVKGFMTQADVIVAWPSTEKQLSEKVGALLGDVSDEDKPAD